MNSKANVACNSTVYRVVQKKTHVFNSTRPMQLLKINLKQFFYNVFRNFENKD